MTLSDLREYCLSLPHTEEKLPFDENTLVFYVMGKIFCLTDLESFQSINLKCDPEKAIDLRETHEEVTGAYHMNKKHWNSISMQGKIPDKLVLQWVQESYDLVVAGLPKKTREQM